LYFPRQKGCRLKRGWVCRGGGGKFKQNTIWRDPCSQVTGTCFIQKIYAPSSSLLQGKHLPFSPSPLRLSILRLFVILSLTQLYRYTPEIFLFSTATFKYTYRAPLRRIGQEKSANVAYCKISVNETDTATSGLRWIFHMYSEFFRPAMCNNATWSSPLKCKVRL
jgi:hypothetical protein